MKPKVLYEDNHLLVIEKPAGLATTGVTDRPSVYQWAGEYIKRRYHKPGNVFVGIVSRLDTLTSGVMVLSRTSKGASRLSDQIRRGTFRKTYRALVEGSLTTDSGRLEDQVYKDDLAHRMRIDHRGDMAGTQTAALEYRCVWRGACLGSAASLVEVDLITGRKHQIRVQFAARRHPIFGDRKYGSDRSLLGGGIGLHSYRIGFQHPTRGEPMQFSSPLPEFWPEAISCTD